MDYLSLYIGNQMHSKQSASCLHRHMLARCMWTAMWYVLIYSWDGMDRGYSEIGVKNLCDRETSSL